MTFTEETLAEVYGVLMMLGIVMNEEQALEALKQSGFDDAMSDFILKTALEVQQITEEHNEKLNEIGNQVHLTPDQTEELAKAYLEAQGISEELIEVVFLYHSFQTTLDIAETVILEGEKQGLSASSIRNNIKELGSLDDESTEQIYISAMTRLGKPYERPAQPPNKAGRPYIFLGLAGIFTGLILFMLEFSSSVFFSPIIMGIAILFIGLRKALN